MTATGQITGKITKEREGVYRVVVNLPRTSAGKYPRLVRLAHSYGEAVDLLDKLRKDARTSGSSVPTRETVAQYLERWLTDYAAVNVTPKTLERYRGIVDRHIIPHLGTVRLRNLRPDDVQHAKAVWTKAGLSPATIRQHLAVLHKALQTAVNNEQIPTNAADKKKVERPKLPHRTVQTVPGMDSKGLLEAIGKPQRKGRNVSNLHTATALAALAGLRRGEICALLWSDVDFKTGTIRVVRSMEQTTGGKLRTKEPKSESGNREVPITPQLATILQAEHKRQAAAKLAGGGDYQSHNLVCPQWNGEPQKPDTLGAAFARAATRRGYPGVTFHTLRRTYCTMLHDQGVPMKDAQALMGHARIETTMNVYTAPSVQRLDRARKAIAAALGDTVG